MSSLVHLLLFFLLFFLLFNLTTFALSKNTSTHPSTLIDCGGINDSYFSGGSPAIVAEPHAFSSTSERTLRFFSPVSYGKTNCYSVPVAPGRYRVRVFTVYDNYDSKLRPPNFDVSVENTVVFGWRRPWPDLVSRYGAYSDLFVFFSDGFADVCFYSVMGSDAPVVGSLELMVVDPRCYDLGGMDVILVNYGRITCGSELFTGDGDRYGRIWQSDAGFRPSSKVRTLSTMEPIKNADVSPDYFPARLYQTAITTVSDGEVIEYSLPVDTEMDYALWFHFAEIDQVVTKIGQRVFDVMVDRVHVKRIDIFKEVGGFSTFQLKYVAKNLTRTPLSVKLVPVVGKPLISGLENYAMAPLGLATVPSQVIAMKALKESLQIPDRMGWNGDPCAPSAWDAWEGVTCHHGKDGLHFVISQLDLGSQGLKGYISDQIQLLSDLVSLNLSSNSLHGTLPFGIGQEPLMQLDLSGNQLSGSIPDSFSLSSLKLVLLNNNELEGQVPGNLYSIGVHGGAIDMSGNKGLCGVPSLPACTLFQTARGFSGGVKVGLGLSSAVILCLFLLSVYLCCKRKRHGYDFVSPDLSSVTSKRNRYHRQKSTMHLEMEPQNPL